MKKLIITGCNGQLGRAIHEQYAKDTEYELIHTDVEELDITNVDAVLALSREVKPYAIINCAAYTNVDRCEVDVDLAYRINAIGARNLAIAAREAGAKLMHVSTDYVFPGTCPKPLTEFDAPGPISMYGKTKYAGEQFVQQFADKYFMIRTAWLYGDGHNFAKTMLKLSEKMDEIGVVMDQFGSPTSALELAKAIKYLLPTENYGLFHGTCEGDTNWAEFAQTVLRLAGKSTRIEPISSEEYKRRFPESASRPAYSILDNYMLRLTTDFRFSSWQDAIAVYMQELMG
ncbi:MAG: dTDP-4-dehydrorhamnose reductase [Lachnospiraceae bacterium]|jgi:dTDP-4-dehydrorhamnose reductase|nr:dTDP-4-dehydrorhamnose reductase [Lachnospiraceae bacterium]MCI9133315.1 dTDP-4-dehydrorhamnose reductase [Lachnospiraceae bacterium]